MACYKTKKLEKLYLGYPHWDEGVKTETQGTKWVDSFKRCSIANWLLVCFSRSGEKAGCWQAAADSAGCLPGCENTSPGEGFAGSCEVTNGRR